MARAVEILIGQPRVLAQRQDNPVVAVPHLPRAEVPLLRLHFGCRHVLAGLLEPQSLDPRHRQAAIRQPSEDSIRLPRCRRPEAAALALTATRAWKRRARKCSPPSLTGRGHETAERSWLAAHLSAGCLTSKRVCKVACEENSPCKSSRDFPIMDDHTYDVIVIRVWG